MEIVERIVNEGHGGCSPVYLVIHSTANPGASALNHVQLYSRGYSYAVQYVLDWTGKVYHTMEDDRLAWAVGSGNRYCVNVEICEGLSQEDFTATWNTAVKFAAYYLNSKGWDISHMISHNDARLKWGGTDHTDPNPYFEDWGKSWEQFVADVQSEMEDDMLPEDVWNFDQNGVLVRDRLQGVDEGVWKVYNQLTRTDDPTGRGMEMTDHDHIKWIAAAISDIAKSLEELKELLQK